jgi:hypothetical protein
MQGSTDLIPSHWRNSKNCLGSGLLSFFVRAFGFILLGILLVSLTNEAVVWSSSDKFCGQFCHSMIWANTAYQKSPHLSQSIRCSRELRRLSHPLRFEPRHCYRVFLFASLQGGPRFERFLERGAQDHGHQGGMGEARPQLTVSFESYLVKFNCNDGFNNLHGDPRYSDLLRRVGLPE